MTVLIEKIAVWGFFVAVLAILVGLAFAVIHISLGTATKVEMNARFDKIDSELKLIRQELSTMNTKISDNMVNHLSTAHVGSHSD